MIAKIDTNLNAILYNLFTENYKFQQLEIQKIKVCFVKSLRKHVLSKQLRILKIILREKNKFGTGSKFKRL